MKFCWVTISVKDLEPSLRFYREVVGLEIERRMSPNPDLEIVFLGAGGTQVELIRDAKGKSYGAGEGISLGFEVASLEKTIEAAKALGCPPHTGPFQPNPSIKFIYIADPEGNRVQFVESRVRPD